MLRTLVTTLTLLAFTMSMVVIPHARAQERDPAAAQALFDEARLMMNAGQYAGACLKLAESQRLDPGIGTLFHLAICYEHAGKLASAWATFLDVSSLATASSQDERAQAANRRASLLEPRLARLKIVVPPEARTPGLEITRDGVLVGEAQWGVALPVDPGAHSLEITAPNKRAASAAITVDEAKTQQFDVPVLEATPGGEVAAEPAAPEPVVQPSSPPEVVRPTASEPPPAAADTSSGPGALVIALGIVGIVGIGTGIAFGVVTSSKNTSSKDECNPMNENLCSAKGVALREDAFMFGDLSTISFVAGGALLATAGVLWGLGVGSDSSAEHAALSIDAGPSGARVAMQGSF